MRNYSGALPGQTHVYTCIARAPVVRLGGLAYARPIINPRCACAVRVTVVGSVSLFVCLNVRPSVKSHLTSGASVSSENAITYSAGNGNRAVAEIQHPLVVRPYIQLAIFN